MTDIDKITIKVYSHDMAQKQSSVEASSPVVSSDSVRIVVFNDAGEFLVVTEKDDPTNRKLPGGKVDPTDPSWRAAAEREADEELKKTALDIGLTEAGILANDDGLVKRGIFLGHLASADALGKLGEDIASAEWFSEATLPDGLNRNHILAAVELARSARSQTTRPM